MNRRKFIKRSALGSIGLGALTGGYVWQIEPFWLEFVKVKMPISNLPDHLVGKSLMQISDIHVGNKFDYNYLIQSFIEAQTFNPDFVVYTGDYVHWENEKQLEQIREVFQYAVKGKLGTAGILGNHDYGLGWSEQHVADNIAEILKDTGINMLINSEIDLNGLNVIGIDDYWALNFDPQKALSNYDETKANLVLCHNPDACDKPLWNNYTGWILSGHTHGGQCRIPGLTPPILPIKNKRYFAGKIDLHDGRTLYVNRALGHLYQIRFFVRPEITIFELDQLSST